jgi:hypothetical protein
MHEEFASILNLFSFKPEDEKEIKAKIIDLYLTLIGQAGGLDQIRLEFQANEGGKYLTTSYRS